jgi:putative ABC transport system ATP-binding protein
MSMTQPANPLIRLEDLQKVFYADDVETHALSGIHFEITEGDYVSIEGPSGCGKSTLLSILALLDRPSAGRYWLGGKVVEELDHAQRAYLRNREIGFVFQAFNLVGHLTVFENVELPLTFRSDLTREARRERVLDALERVHMGHRPRHYPGQLSGGQQQRVAIARALCTKPQLVLFDEPTASLDPEMVNEVLQTMESLAIEGMTMMIVTHEMRFARRVADRVLFMDQGQIIETSPPDEFFDRPQSPRLQSFLGQLLSH